MEGTRTSTRARRGVTAAAVLLLPLTAACTVTLELGHAGVEMLSGLLGFVVWTLANLRYIDYRRFSEPSGLKRFFAFWFGFPGTLVSLFAVSRGRPELIPPDHAPDADALLAEWRKYQAAAALTGREPGQAPTAPEDARP